jgi:hypothetical protein
MFKRLFPCIAICFCILHASSGFAADASGKEKDTVRVIAEKIFGDGKFLRADAPEPSHVAGWQQVRIWVKSPYGERPYLIYIEGDKDLYFIGSVFDSGGSNLTEANTGAIKPKVLTDEEMHLDDRFRIGPKDAKVKVVLWIGVDLSAKYIFENVNKVYRANRDTMAIYIKFFPRGEAELNRMKPLTCFSGEVLEAAYKVMLDADPNWGTPDDLKQFKEARGVKADSACAESVLQEDVMLAKRLDLPGLPSVFVNGTMLLDRISRDSISRLAGVELK